MDILKIRIVDISGKGYQINETVKVSEIQPVDVKSLPIETVKVEGVMKKVGKNYLFEGQIAGFFIHACDRCLDETRYEINKQIIWLFEQGRCDSYLNIIVDTEKGEDRGKKGKDKDEFDELAEKRTYQGDEINLAPYIWEELVLDMPYKFLCKEDCAGLCPICGTNLNHNICTCKKDADDESMHLTNTKLSELLQGMNLNIKED
ncbi:MAG: DUF177 domain-containing protein [Candidatus Hydrogenedens sp.]|nr:DUF177 domain-containing protein [Candidatus Hydrogenedens sp.]